MADLPDIYEPPEINTQEGVTDVSLQQELLLSAVDDYYDHLARKGYSPELGRDSTKFTLVDGQLRLKAYRDLGLTNIRTSEPLALSTLAGRPGGTAAIREGLGFVDWRKPSLPRQAVSALQSAESGLGEAASALSKNIELQDFGAVGQSVTEASGATETALQELETSFTEEQIAGVLGTMDDPPLSLRELRGLDRAMRTMQGELVNNLARLSEIDNHINLEQRKLELLEQADPNDVSRERRKVSDRLQRLKDERAARLEAASENRKSLRSQINRIRETFRHILQEDTTLGERIRTLFREQGITVVSILTAIGMAISTLVLALTGGNAAGFPAKPPSGHALRDWVKRHLQNLGRALANLAGKAAAAIPGVIGSLVSWLLSTLGKTATWLATNLWAVVLALGGLLLIAAQEWLSSH